MLRNQLSGKCHASSQCLGCSYNTGDTFLPSHILIRIPIIGEGERHATQTGYERWDRAAKQRGYQVEQHETAFTVCDLLG